MNNFDFNLLKVLRVLLEVNNTKKAGEILNLSQSSISKSLAKLRAHYNDPLFIRSHYGLEQTPKAIQLSRELPLLLNSINKFIVTDEIFSPRQCSQRVKIAMNSAILHSIGADLVMEIINIAPNIELHLLHWNRDSEIDIVRGDIDIGVNYLSLDISKKIQQKVAFNDDFICVVRKGHPLENSAVSADTLSEYDVISLIIPSWNNNKIKIQESLKIIDKKANIKIRTTSLGVILQLVEKTDLLFPIRYSSSLKLDNDKFTSLKFDDLISMPEAKIVILTEKTRTHDPLIDWLSSKISELICRS